MRAALAIALVLSACSLVESFEGYSDDWGQAGSAGAAATGGVGGSGGAWPDASDDAHVPACTGGFIACGATCTRTESDPENCGSCGVVVDPAEYCVAGEPVCRPRTTLCTPWTTTEGYSVDCDESFKCTDTNWDGSHCVGPGGSKSRCYWTSTTTGMCIDGDCEYDVDCPLGRMACNSTLSNVKSCFDVENDSNHCGGCHKQCQPGETCAGGVCQPYAVAKSCDECAATMKCCSPMPSAWAHPTICIGGDVCPK